MILKIKVLALILIFSSIEGFSQEQVKINHNSEITQTMILADKEKLVSIDKLGFFSIWSIEDGFKLYSGYTGLSKILKAKTNPIKNQFAVLGQNHENTFIIFVFDLDIKGRVAFLKLPEEPIFWNFSGGGNYLISSYISDPKIQVFKTDTFEKEQSLMASQDTLDFHYVGTTEKQLFSYSKKGFFSYTEFKEEKKSNRLKTDSNIQELSISNDKNFIFGIQQNRLLTYDRKNGQLVNIQPFLKEISYIQDPYSSAFIVFEKNQKYDGAKLYTSTSKKFDFKKDLKFTNASEISSLTISNNLIITGFLDGRVQIQNEKITKVFQDEKLLKIHDFVATNDSLLFLANEKLYIAQKQFWEDDKSFLNYFGLPEVGIGKLALFGLDQVYLYYPEQMNAGIYLFQNEKWKVVLKPRLSIKKILVKEEKLIVLETNGKLKIFDKILNKLLFETNDSMYLDISLSKENKLLYAGQESTDGCVGSIDLDTYKNKVVIKNLIVGKRILSLENSNSIWLFWAEKNRPNLNYLSLFENNQLRTQDARWSTIENPDVFQLNNGSIMVGSIEGLKKFNQDGEYKSIEAFNVPSTAACLSENTLITRKIDGSLELMDVLKNDLIGTIYLFDSNDWVFMDPQNVPSGPPASFRHLHK